MRAPFALRVSRFWLAAERGYGDHDFNSRLVDYVIKRFLFQRRVPHPLPPDLRPDPEAVAMYSFNQYGNNMCCFGSFEDTLPLDSLKPKTS